MHITTYPSALQLLKVHPYRTASIIYPVFSITSEEDGDDVDWLIYELLAAAKAKGLVSSLSGHNHIVLEFEDGLLISWSDFRLTVGIGLRLGSW